MSCRTMRWGILLCIVYALRIIHQAYFLRMYSVLRAALKGERGDAHDIVAGDFVSRDFVLWRGGEVVSSSVYSRFLWKWVAVQSGFNALLFVLVAAWRGGIFCWWKDFFSRRRRRRRRRRSSQDEWLRGFQAGAADGAFHKTGSWREGKWDLCRCRRGEGRK